MFDASRRFEFQTLLFVVKDMSVLGKRVFDSLEIEGD